eukprot:TRINITY_DN69563_c0_g1_i1.p1 TRINITY_DN69563_c0_g1~~TRINITY_DN69563_c0_g1_i1.p1  ORF type:complete len:219 (+),score=54.99 TRINITY_DN69563_c0_g1_i1:65-658(+)
MSEGVEALCQACLDGRLEDVERLSMQVEALETALGPGGMPPLHYAAMARRGASGAAEILLRFKADVQKHGPENKQAIHIAAENEQGVDVLRVLLEARADPDAPTLARRTPLHFAAVDGIPNTAKVLLEAKADANAMNSCGAIPLHWAAKTGKPDLVQMLLAARSDLTVMDNLGRTPVEMAEDNLKNDCASIIRAAAL